MSSVVCQNFQSCFEPRTLGLQVPSNQLAFLCDMRSHTVSESRFNTEQPQKYYNHGTNNNNTYKQKTTNSDSWSSIESITEVDEVDEKKEKSTYIHPLVKRSSSALSGKSLELCTETLGCETGTNVDDNNVSFSNSSMSSNSVGICRSPARKTSNSQQFSMHEKVITSPQRSFPPPLTSIGNSSDCNVQFRPHREGGRLVIKAIAVATSPTCFQAERVDGRLRLLLKEQVFNEDQEQEEEEEDENDGAKIIDEEEINKDSNVSEETDVIKGDVVTEVGIGNLHRHRRCKESGNKAELAKWDHFCVAT
ncbi:hypothetical protein MKX01_012178 [Papaver californicum]|nr:hypothetical protein MKX01_012178 [Papaver californicum]